MRAGAAQVDITPAMLDGVELSGYAARRQPAVGVLDQIFARAIFLQDGQEKLLWVTADVIALPGALVAELRAWAKGELGLEAQGGQGQVLLSATHTHAAPATVSLTGCGVCSAAFLRQLGQGMRQAARQAVAAAGPCRVVAVQQELRLAVDRRDKASAHVDPRVTAVGFVRGGGEGDETFIAAALNYAMHPVTLSHDNRQISADWPGYASAALSAALPGNPVVLVSNGACGNINPPLQTTDVDSVRGLGEQVARAVEGPMLETPAEDDAPLRLALRTVPLPLETLTAQEIDRIADAARETGDRNPAWQRALGAAIDTWRQTVRDAPANAAVDIDLLAARIGPMRMLAVNGEMFSLFAELLRQKTGERIFVVAYANAAFGYIPTRQAYAEGGYEVERAHFFYNSLRPRIGGLEMLADEAAALVASL